MLRKAALLLSGNAAAALLTLVRNLLVARLIPVADYGIAATFAVAMAVVEMVSALGLQQQIVQAKEGEDERFQAALQGFQLLRGIAAGAAMLALAHPLAAFLDIPQAAWGYMVLAAVPVLNALQHFDIHRLTRTHRFGPMILTGVVPAALALAAVWPLAHWFGDWQVMLWSLLIQAAFATAVSHLVAERRFRLRLDRAEMARSFRFGWPLLLNGALLFLVFNGDKLIVGRILGMETLAVFAMGVTLTLTPTLVMAKTVLNVFLPRLSKTAEPGSPQDMQGEHNRQLLIEVTAFAAVLQLVFWHIAGEQIILTVLGERYGSLPALATIMAAAFAFRMVKTAPAVIALSLGDTQNTLVGNLPKIVSLPVTYFGLAGTLDIRIALLLAVLSEALGLALSLMYQRREARKSFYRNADVLFGIAILAALISAQELASASQYLSHSILRAIELADILLLAYLTLRMRKLWTIVARNFL